MDMNTYENLVETVKNGLRNGKYKDFVGDEEIDFDEINPWTYWQGRGVRHPKILLVGQDWGTFQQLENCKKDLMYIKNNQMDSDKIFYFEEKKRSDFITDKNLIEYFKILGYPDISKKKEKDLFFTNLIPGVRKEGKSSGGFKRRWINKNVKSDFVELIHILKPTVILCLGRETFRGVQIAIGKTPISDDVKWNDYLDGEGESPIEYDLGGENTAYIFAMPHPGNFGVLNRGKEKAEKDWKRVAMWMKEDMCKICVR